MIGHAAQKKTICRSRIGRPKHSIYLSPKRKASDATEIPTLVNSGKLVRHERPTRIVRGEAKVFSFCDFLGHPCPMDDPNNHRNWDEDMDAHDGQQSTWPALRLPDEIQIQFGDPIASRRIKIKHQSVRPNRQSPRLNVCRISNCRS